MTLPVYCLDRPRFNPVKLVQPAMYFFSLNLPARARLADHVEVVPRLRRPRWIDCLHQLLEDLLCS
jgi:hypothetical protein